MIKQLIPNIPILDVELNSEYRLGIVVMCRRMEEGKYLIQTNLLDTVYSPHVYSEGQKIVYKINKRIEDEKCTSKIIE